MFVENEMNVTGATSNFGDLSPGQTCYSADGQTVLMRCSAGGGADDPGASRCYGVVLATGVVYTTDLTTQVIPRNFTASPSP